MITTTTYRHYFAALGALLLCGALLAGCGGGGGQAVDSGHSGGATVTDNRDVRDTLGPDTGGSSSVAHPRDLKLY